MKKTFCLTAALFISAMLAAQAPQTLRVDVRLVNVVATVADGHGPQHGLFVRCPDRRGGVHHHDPHERTRVRPTRRPCAVTETGCAMRVGVLELLIDSQSRGQVAALYSHYYRSQYMSLMPQAVAVWCRQLGHRVTHVPGELSGGERQRVALARALVTEPRCILADEPTGNLDPKTSERVFHALTQLVRASGLAMICATHNMEIAGRMDRRVTLKDGAVVEME